MKITQIEVNVARTINMGDFNSARVGVRLVAELEPNQDSDIAFEELYLNARRKLLRKVEGLIDNYDRHDR